MNADRTHAPVEDWGHFDDEAREFVLTTPRPPRHWKNLLWNARYNCQPTQAGAGISYRRDDDGTIVLLNWSGEKCLYVHDLDTGRFFAAGYWPVCDDALERFTCRYGQGYHVIAQQCLHLRVEVAVTVPREGCAELYRVSLTDLSGRARRLRVVAHFDLDLNLRDAYFGSANRFECLAAPDGGSLCVRNVSHAADRQWNAFLAADRPFEGFCFERREFLGAYGGLARPEGLACAPAGGLDAPDDPAITASVAVALAPGGTETLHLAFGNEPDEPDVLRAAARWAGAETFRRGLAEAAGWHRRRDEVLRVRTPDAQFDRFVNVWLPHQLEYCAYWNRGWGKGFRDGMQDAWAYLLIDPAHVRRMIADALPHQYPDGRTVRKWAPVDRKEYNDGPVWLALAVWAYVAETGDAEFLREPFGFFESGERADVLEHLRRGVEGLHARRGAHGLCLMPFGDWNDQLTGPGRGGRGESVWTTMALAGALPREAELALTAGRDELAASCTRARDDLAAAVRAHAWNGRWFNRAFTDDGAPVGHGDCPYGRIFLLPQAWAVLAGLADAAQRDAALAACFEHLRVEHGWLLLAPAWRQYDPAIGELSARPPGVVENGSNYCHASAFMVAALCECGRKDDALDTFLRLLPTNPANPPSRSWQEPFSVTNTYRGPEAGRSAGRAMFSWRTGTAGWLLRTAVEGILGVRAELAGLRVDGSLPGAWDRAELVRRFRGRRVSIRFERTGRASLAVDGAEIRGPVIPAGRLADGSQVVCTF